MRLIRLLIVILAVLVGGVAAGGWYMLAVPGRSWSGPAPPLTDDERDLAGRLERHVRAIASEPHNTRHPAALEAAANYIEREVASFGYRVGRQEFNVDGINVRNIDATLEPAAGPPQAVGSLVIGAHYDSFRDAPGATDNGSGVAALIELARKLAGLKPSQSRVRFVFFVNEEPPYFQTPNMGSWRYAEALSERQEKVRGLIALETLGTFSSEPGSQRYPLLLRALSFPDRADFVAFVGMLGSRTFLHDVLGSFRRHAKVPSIGGVGPWIIPGIGWSDHWSFAQFGFPALMLTDTALFRSPDYHRRSDTPDKVNYEMLARITGALAQVVVELADRQQTGN
ncbi:MAG: M28 family peptidase [Hyphomicrobiaceae bacterium]